MSRLLLCSSSSGGGISWSSPLAERELEEVPLNTAVELVAWLTEDYTSYFAEIDLLSDLSGLRP